MKVYAGKTRRIRIIPKIFRDKVGEIRYFFRTLVGFFTEGEGRE